MKKNLILALSFIMLAFTACNDNDGTNNETPTGVAFSDPSLNLSADETPVLIKFSQAAPTAGTITISYVNTAVAYGTDYSTTPAAVDGKIVVAFAQGATTAEFTFNKIINAIEGEVKNVVFTIESVSINATISSNKTLQANFNETASLGTALAPTVGGPTQPNQVYIDLSSGAMTQVPRVSWDLGFYCGTEFRVAINGSLKMAAKQLETTNIDEVQEADPSMIIGQGTGVYTQIDGPTGDILTTAIAEVSDNDANNKVYLINMGSNPGSTPPAVGSDGSASGTSRGWKKIRILKSGADYKIQYADIASTTHEEAVISKDAAYNFSFFSLTTKAEVDVEPAKSQWDINFTTFTNILGGTTPYYYPDYVVTNLKGDARSYMVMIEGTVTYDSFTLANVDELKFTDDQRNIGSNWRSTSVVGGDGIPVSQFVLKTDRFFVIQDPAGNIYKLKFTGGANEAGERGYPKFQYALLQ